MTEREAFLRRIFRPLIDAAINDHADCGYYSCIMPRTTDAQRADVLTFADWLEERGEGQEAAFYRWLADLESLPFSWAFFASADIPHSYGYQPWCVRIDPIEMRWCAGWLHRHRPQVFFDGWRPYPLLDGLFRVWKLWQELQRLAVPECHHKAPYLTPLTPERLGVKPTRKS